jgi:F0F1-type ATP synthase delta subunit
MPYVLLDENNHIVAVYTENVDGAVEVAPDDPALKEFIYRNHPEEEQREKLLKSDLTLARVMEDLIDVLIEKGVIMFTDFPEAAQKKLLERRGFRKEFSYVQNLFGNEEGGLGDHGAAGGEAGPDPKGGPSGGFL